MSTPAGTLPRIALIGVSGYARIYLQLLREHHDRGGVEICAVVIINPVEEALAVTELQQRGARIYGDYEEMLRQEAGKLDLCLVPTGIPWHARMTIAALKSGANVLVEKPLAGSVSEVAAIEREESSSGRFVAVGFQDIYAPEAIWLKKELLAGVVGSLRSLSFLGLWPRDASYFQRNNWAGRLGVEGVPVLDSPMNNAFAHFVNLCLFFAGAKLDESASAREVEAELYRAHSIETFDTAVVRAKVLTDEARLWFGCSHSCESNREPELRIEGSRGQVEWFHEQRCVIRVGNEPPRIYPLPETAETRRAMFATVLRRLSDPLAPICGTTMAREHTALVEAIHANGEIRTVPESQIRRLTLPGAATAIPCIQGLEEFMQVAFVGHALLREVGLNVPRTGGAGISNHARSAV